MQYDTAWSQFFTTKIRGKTETIKENILTHWSVAQAGSHDEKNWRSKILLDCPFERIQCFSLPGEHVLCALYYTSVLCFKCVIIALRRFF